MARRTRRPPATGQTELEVASTVCPGCGSNLNVAYYNGRTLTTLQGVTRFRLQVRRCHRHRCPLYRRPIRPEAEGRLALPHHEFGLDVVALVGALRYTCHNSVPEIHHELRRRGLALAQRTVSNLLDRYDELLALNLSSLQALKPRLLKQGRLVLGIDGLQPDVGHEVLWVIRDCLSGEILLAKSLLSASQADLSSLLKEVTDALDVPVAAVVSDGQLSIRNAVALALPGVPHQLCHFHYLREAARPIYEADRHAKKELKKRVRGIRAIERQVEDKEGLLTKDKEGLLTKDKEGLLTEVVQGYCAAVRAALTDDGRPPLDAKGLLLEGRLSAVAASLERLAEEGGLPKQLTRLREVLRKGLAETAELFPPVRVAFGWVRRVARVLDNSRELPGKQVKGRLRKLLRQMAVEAKEAEKRGQKEVAEQLGHFAKVSRSYRPGLCHCYDVEGLPRTNNDLEHVFGSYRYHERRASGRKVASAAMVVRGSVRLMAGVMTRLHPVNAEELAPVDLQAWQKLRRQLDQRREARRRQRRFRHDPSSYLDILEKKTVQSGLLS